MLRILRENTGNWIIKIFLGIIVLVFIFFFGSSFGPKRDNSVAKIDKEPITIREYQRSYKFLISQMEKQFGKNLNEEILKALNIKQQALNMLIEEKLLLKQADELKITVSDKELQENLISFQAFHVDGKFNFEQYKTILELNGLTPEMFEQQQIDSIKRQKVRQFITSAVAVSDLEARDWYLYMNTKMAVDYLKFDPKSYSELKIEEKDIQEYYDSKKENFKSEPKIIASYLKFSASDYKDSINVTDDQINGYYQDNIEDYQTPEMVEARHILILADENADENTVAKAKQKAMDVYEKASKGEDFAELAKKHSEGPSSVEGGYLGKFSRSRMIPPFSDKAFSMKPGEIGTPIRTKYGWHVIKVLARFEPSTKTLDQVSAQIKKKIELEEMRLKAEDKADEAFQAVDEGDGLEQVAAIVNKTIETTKPFTISGESLTIPYREKFAQSAFALETGDTSDIQYFGDTYYLIKVIEKIEPVVQEFSVVKNKVKNELKAKRQNEKAKMAAEELIAQAKDIETLEQLADKNNYSIKTTQLFKRDETDETVGNVPGFNQASFSLTEDKKIYPELIESDSGYYIIGLNRIEPPSEDQIQKNLKETATNIVFRKQAQAYNSWLEELKKQYKITYNPKLLN